MQIVVTNVKSTQFQETPFTWVLSKAGDGQCPYSFYFEYCPSNAYFDVNYYVLYLLLVCLATLICSCK